MHLNFVLYKIEDYFFFGVDSPTLGRKKSW